MAFLCRYGLVVPAGLERPLPYVPKSSGCVVPCRMGSEEAFGAAYSG